MVVFCLFDFFKQNVPQCLQEDGLRCRQAAGASLSSCRVGKCLCSRVFGFFKQVPVVSSSWLGFHVFMQRVRGRLFLTSSVSSCSMGLRVLSRIGFDGFTQTSFVSSSRIGGLSRPPFSILSVNVSFKRGLNFIFVVFRQDEHR